MEEVGGGWRRLEEVEGGWRRLKEVGGGWRRRTYGAAEHGEEQGVPPPDLVRQHLGERLSLCIAMSHGGDVRGNASL